MKTYEYEHGKHEKLKLELFEKTYQARKRYDEAVKKSSVSPFAAANAINYNGIFCALFEIILDNELEGEYEEYKKQIESKEE
jgi:hypothetical protein